jgi:hypothetical protein
MTSNIFSIRGVTLLDIRPLTVLNLAVCRRFTTPSPMIASLN